MQRTLLETLTQWKAKTERKPLLIDGARQTGKTYLLKQLFGQQFKHVLRIDFLESPFFADAFADSLSPNDLLNNIQLLTGKRFDAANDLLILDEIGECPRAVTALKYFAEQRPDMFVAASGSNIGLLQSFPVGKVEQYNLRPLTFREFLQASHDDLLLSVYDQQANSEAVHHKLMDKLTDYYFTGGMPEAVARWFNGSNEPLLERIEAVSEIHRNLLLGYVRDFGKYSGATDATLIEAVFNSVPSQLFAVRDDSVKRFKFKGVYERKSRYNDYESAISWLEKCRLISKNFPIEGRPRAPLVAYKKENLFKLFLFDTGLLNHMLGLSYKELKQQGFEYKGFIAENYVQQELVARGYEPTYSWADARAEIEFLITTGSGDVLPVEVKSGIRTRARSLQSYRQKCQPHKTIKLTATRGSGPSETDNITLPLYYASQLP